MQFPETVVPRIVNALQAVVAAVEAAASAETAAPSTPLPATPSATGAQLAAPKWAALLTAAVGELGAVQGLLPLHTDWKAQLSGAFAALLRALLAAARRHEQHPLLSGFRTALTAGRQRLPLTSADAAQVGRGGVV